MRVLFVSFEDKKVITIVKCNSTYFRQFKKKSQTKYRLIKQVNFIKVLLKMFKRESNRDVFNIEEKKVYCC